MTWDKLWNNLRIATMDLDHPGPYGTVAEGAADGALVIEDGKIAWIGRMVELPPSVGEGVEILDGEGRWITPGLIDCHTHLVYGGNRAEEFELRLSGVGYEEIARRGGGILSTVRATREATEEMLVRSAGLRLRNLLEEGVTGVEIKSGYGLELEAELKMLRVAKILDSRFPVEVRTTFLGAHTTPPEFQDGASYLDYLCRDVLPAVRHEELADAVDIFCEGIAFDLQQTETYLDRARARGFEIKIHAEQLSHLGGAALAASKGALSADHLEYLDEAGIRAMKAAGTVAVLLPGAFYYLRETRVPPVAGLREHGVPMAIASDCNPGSSPVESLLLILNMACTLFGMTPSEALAGVTRNAAAALGWSHDRGVLRVGHRADLVFWDIDNPAELAYRVGNNPCFRVLLAGDVVLERGASSTDSTDGGSSTPARSHSSR